MGEKVSTEIGEAMRHQTKVLSALVLISLVLLGGAAGVSFIGDGFGVSVSTAHAMKEAEPAAIDPIAAVEVVEADPLTASTLAEDSEKATGSAAFGEQDSEPDLWID